MFGWMDGKEVSVDRKRARERTALAPSNTT